MKRQQKQIARIRKRLFETGGLDLADYELLALLLSPGGSNSSLSLALELVEHIGGIRELGRRGHSAFVRYKGIGQAASARLLAAMELGRRLAVAEPKRKDAIRSSEQVAEWFRSRLQHLSMETVHALLLDAAHHPLASLCIGKGTWNNCQVDPKTVFSACLDHRASAIILAHNHPSGDPEPSRQDVSLTDRMVNAGKLIGVTVLDHIIVGSHGYYSFAEAGFLIG